MNNEPVAWAREDGVIAFHKQKEVDSQGFKWFPLYTHPAKTLTDEDWNKAFDYYCETDEGVLKFDLELRDEWKKEQLIRWKEALRKAQEK
jgi:hypothetical protein